MPFGIDSTGYNLKTIDDILASIRTRQQALFGAAFAAQLDTSVVGQLNGVFANEMADLWLLGQSVWRSRYPSTATGVSLDLVAQETGATRLPATSSTVTLTFSGSNGTIVPVGTVVAVDGSGAQFQTTEAGTISGGTVDLEAEALETGAVLAPAGTLTVMVSAIAGVTSVTNALDAELGTDIETDAAFRLRRSQLLRQSGSGTVAAIRADVRAVEDVDEVYVYNNPTSSTSVDGLPPHSFEVVVRGGADADIRQAIFDSQPAGIESYGTTSGTVTDEQGDSQTVKFTRPTDVDMWVDVEVVIDSANFPTDGDDQIKQAIVDYWESSDQRIGKDVVVNAFYGSIYAIPGVSQVTVLEIDDINPPVNTTTTAITSRQIAVFDTSRITVTHV
jgi:uncharacterized phage protein gp47/JayE